MQWLFFLFAGHSEGTASQAMQTEVCIKLGTLGKSQGEGENV